MNSTAICTNLFTPSDEAPQSGIYLYLAVVTKLSGLHFIYYGRQEVGYACIGLHQSVYRFQHLIDELQQCQRRLFLLVVI